MAAGHPGLPGVAPVTAGDVGGTCADRTNDSAIDVATATATYRIAAGKT